MLTWDLTFKLSLKFVQLKPIYNLKKCVLCVNVLENIDFNIKC